MVPEFGAADDHDSPLQRATADQGRDPNDLRNGERVGRSCAKAVVTREEPIQGKLDDPTRANALRGIDDDNAGARWNTQKIIDTQLADDPQSHIDRQAITEEGGCRNWSTVVASVGQATHQNLDGDGMARGGPSTGRRFTMVGNNRRSECH